jgi:hypothetical protein
MSASETRRPVQHRYAVAGVALALTLVGCGGDEPSARPTSPPTSTSPSSTPSPSTPAPTPSGSPEPSRTAAPELDWQRVDGPIRDSVTRNADWTLTVVGNGRSWSLDGPQGSSGAGSSDWRVSDALLDERWAVVVLQDPAESKPSRAEVTDLRTGETFTIDGTSDVPTTTGGTWALGGDDLMHATVGPGRAYCVATVDLATRESRRPWCAPKRHGFNGGRLAPGGASVLSFDAGRPSCRTLMAITDTGATPFEGVEECSAWDGLLTADGQVWSVIPDERRIEQAHFHATAGGEQTDLGPGVAGSLTWCADSAWFTRDPENEGDPAALMRWSPTAGLSVAYESPGGQAFLSEPRCGGDQITVTALAEDGDEQVTTRLR